MASRRPEQQDLFQAFADHPRFGRAPRWTTLETSGVPAGYAAWIPPDPALEDVGEVLRFAQGAVAGASAVIPDTAVSATDLDRQQTPVPALYFVSRVTICRGCERPFVFHAEEHRHWVETLGFSPWARCELCLSCRADERAWRALRRRFEELTTRASLSPTEALERLTLRIELTETGIFARGGLDEVAGWMTSLPEDMRRRAEAEGWTQRLRALRESDLEP